MTGDEDRKMLNEKMDGSSLVVGASEGVDMTQQAPDIQLVERTGLGVGV